MCKLPIQLISKSNIATYLHAPHVQRDEVEFRWTGNKLFLPGDANRTVGEVYNTYLTGNMAHFYSAVGPTTKKASGSKPQFSMAVELYIDKPKVSPLYVRY